MSVQQQKGDEETPTSLVVEEESFAEYPTNINNFISSGSPNKTSSPVVVGTRENSTPIFKAIMTATLQQQNSYNSKLSPTKAITMSPSTSSSIKNSPLFIATEIPPHACTSAAFDQSSLPFTTDAPLESSIHTDSVPPFSIDVDIHSTIEQPQNAHHVDNFIEQDSSSTTQQEEVTITTTTTTTQSSPPRISISKPAISTVETQFAQYPIIQVFKDYKLEQKFIHEFYGTPSYYRYWVLAIAAFFILLFFLSSDLLKSLSINIGPRLGAMFCASTVMASLSLHLLRTRPRVIEVIVFICTSVGFILQTIVVGTQYSRFLADNYSTAPDGTFLVAVAAVVFIRYVLYIFVSM